MANKVENKIGCQAGKTKIVDPNNFYGFNSESNLSVPLEDLNISVVLKTKRKGRTVLTSSGDEATTGTKESTNTMIINFIEGSDVAGKKVLTTNYTDLTALASDSNNDEALGITNIEIDFNSSMAPMVNINFVDVRGSAIFQNEQNISGNNTANKYSTFFQLPYPKFELEIKGYYGKPVTYCLHMLKFNSKFNSQTGNFEISCQFIGYTYAMLSDMLMGYLKAIPFTDIGADIYQRYNTERGYTVLTLVELMKKIEKINEGVEKIASDSPYADAYGKGESALEDLSAIESTINSLGTSLDITGKSDTKDKYLYIVKNDKDLTEDEKANIETYKTNIKENISLFNEREAGATLDENYFLLFDTLNTNKGLYNSVTKEMFDPTKLDIIVDNKLKETLGSPTNFDEIKKNIFSLLSKDYTVGDKTLLDIYNMNGLFDKIDVAKASVNKQIKANKEKLAEQLKVTVANTLGFEPTVRRLVEVFTTAIEVFMETIYTVSTRAEAKDNNDRTAQLEAKFGTNIVNSDIKKPNLEIKEFFAWPDYREKNETTKTYVDKYLGEPGVLDRPQDVDELLFIDDLLKAFLKAQQLSNEVAEDMEEGETTWYPVNPIDANTFIETEPYSRAELLSENDVIRLMLIRGMTFLGYTNDSTTLDVAEIQGMAVAEADAIVRGVTNRNVRQTLSSLKLDSVKKIQGTINGTARDVVKRKTTVDGVTVEPFYYYDYIFQGFGNADSFKLIPISGGFNNESWGVVSKEVTTQNNPFNTPTQIPGTTPIQTPFQTPIVGTAANTTTSTQNTVNTNINYSNLENRKNNNNDFFLTNYSSAYGENGKTDRYYKYLDGGRYISILKTDEYDTLKQLYPIEGIKTDIIPLKLTVLDEEDLTPEQIKEAGFNTFAGPLGIQDFSMMDFGEPDLNGLPLKYAFYSNYRAGLTYTRKYTFEKLNIKKPKLPYDLKTSGTIKYTNGTLGLQNTETYEKLHDSLGKNRLLFNIFENGDKATVTYPYILQPCIDVPRGDLDSVTYGIIDGTDYASFSLFGSNFYYQQEKSRVFLKNGTNYDSSKYAKAILFLNTLPFVGNGFNMDADLFTSPDSISYITHLFDIRGGFVHVPRLWCAYIGGLLWRFNSSDPEIDANGVISGGGSGSKDIIIWKVSKTDFFPGPPTRNEYFPIVWDGSTGDFDHPYPEMTEWDLMLRLPHQVKEEFKRVFFDFVNGTDGLDSWDSIKDELEIWNGTATEFANYLSASHFNGANENLTDTFNVSKLDKLINKDKYSVITPIKDAPRYLKNCFWLELKDGYGSNVAVTKLIDALSREMVIANNSFTIWRGPKKTDFGTSGNWKTNLREEIYANEKVFDVYFNAIIKRLTDTADSYSPTKEKKELEQQIFGTANEDTIKLQLYRTCKNIHDKWLAGTTDPKAIIFQCGVNNRSRVDSQLALQYGSSATPRLIDSFRFISRSFRDIGDLLYVNPLPINNFLLDNPNTSSYDAISQLLTDNNFDFIALPTFINFRDAKEVEAIFQPYGSYEQALSAGTCGPSFVCAYVGQKSQHLDYSSSDYPNDGFDLRCLNGDIDPSVPDDFKTDNELHEDPVGAFVVRYSQQNQNIFKDINLDQSEFSETDESLQIQDDISQKGADTNRTIAGQNLYNVYAVRSYTAEVEMMGNAMMQPMMYFQLDNIPMFHGAYMITRVRHSIKPNHMSTNFTGVRIRYAETPLITAMDLYMSFVDSMELSGGNGAGVISGSFQPIIVTLIDNGVRNGYMELGKTIGSITNKTVDLSGTKFNNIAGPNGFMITEAADAFKKMLTELTTWIDGKVNDGVLKGKKVGNKVIYGEASSFYRPYSIQKNIEGNNNTAKAGTSYHGWGVAVDWTWVDKNGKLFVRNYGGKGGSPASDFDFKKDPILEWLYNNSYRFGFINPKWARNGGSYDEVWHWEYHGKSAKCLMEGNEVIFNQKIDITKRYDAITKNPKTLDGVEAIYTGCAYKTIEKGDGVQNALKTEAGCPSVEKPMKVQTSYKGSINKLLTGTYKCGANRDCNASIEGFKKVDGFFTNGALNKKGVIALTQGLLEGFGSSPERRNPGNLRGDKSYAVYGTWKEGWTRYLNDKLIRWSDGNPVATKSASYVKCYDKDSNEIFKKTGVKYKENIEYNYKQGQSPTLRQYTNIYAPWGDNNNPTNYCAAIAITLKDYGYDINVDDKMDTWI